MNPFDLLIALNRAGVVAQMLPGSKLKLSPKRKLTPQLLKLARRHKAALVSLLSGVRRPEHVLVTVAPDGFVECFGNRELVRVQIVSRLNVAPSTEALAETYLDATLSPAYRRQHLPVNLLATGSVQDCLNVEVELERVYKLRLIQAVQQAAQVNHQRRPVG